MADLLRDHAFAGHAAMAAGAVSVATSLTHPLDTLKTLLQVSASPKQKLDLFQVAERVRMASGLAGIYNGLGWSILCRISGLGARFGIYEILSAFYKDGREDNYVYVSEALLAGFAAGAVEAVVCTPFELFKLRAQVSASSFKTLSSASNLQETAPVISKLLPGYAPDIKSFNSTINLLSTLSSDRSNLVGTLKQYPWMLSGSGRPPLASEVKEPSRILTLEGCSALWRGLRPGIARDSVFGGVFFSTWQFIHIGLLNWKAVDINPPPRSVDEVGPVSPLAMCLAAGISGTVAAAASHPFDTAKCRLQCIVTPKYISMERKFFRWNAPGNWFERRTGMSPADRNVIYRGIWLRMLRSGVASFLVVGSYLLAVDNML